MVPQVELALGVLHLRLVVSLLQLLLVRCQRQVVAFTETAENVGHRLRESGAPKPLLLQLRLLDASKRIANDWVCHYS
jgi:hypothetical protein